MATRAIKPKRDDGSGRVWPTLPERAPSIIRADAPTPGRVIALISVLFIAMGGLGMLAPQWGMRYILSPTWGFLAFALGVAGLLFHAFNEKDQQFRRTYAALGFVLFCAGVALRILPFEDVLGGRFLSYGVPSLALALGFLASAARNETDALMRNRIHRLIGIAGAVMAAAGFFFSTTDVNFLAGEGIVLILLGLVYLVTFIGLHERGSPQAYYSGMALGAVGLLAFNIALVRSILPIFVPTLESYVVPNGLLLMALGLIYVFVSLAICSDWTIVVLTRRELASFFYSPVAYLLILATTLIGWLMYWQFVAIAREATGGGFGPEQRGLPEPIIRFFILDFVPVIALIFVVPLITMRLLSEEQRTGTLEMLLTAPVNEGTVVLSKFLAALFVYFMAWLPWALYLVAFRVIGHEPFDYRPMLSFFMALLASGAAFLALGLFFSSLTRNQIIAAVLTFTFLLGLTGLFFFKRSINFASPLNEIVTYMSHIDLWISALEGQLAPRLLTFHVTMAVFFLYLTTKVLDSRRWK
jgi:gliding motility-associated transport system permease protein